MDTPSHPVRSEDQTPQPPRSDDLTDPALQLVRDVQWPAFALDAHGLVTEWNSEMARVSRVSRSSVINQPYSAALLQFVAISSQANWAAAADKAYAGIAVPACDLSVRTEDTSISAEMTCCLTPGFDSQMNVARVIVICFNITSSLPTFTVDQSLIVCEWNASLSKCTGLEAKEVINKPVLELIHVTHSSMLEKVSHVHSGLAKDR